MRILFFLLIVSNSAFSQASLSGLYSYASKPEGNPPKDEGNNGPAGTISLLKMEGNKYRFWLDVTIGWPSYNQGQLDGIIVFKADAASFEVNFEDDEHPCKLAFRKKGSTITINSQSTSYNCGFGQGVVADGAYTKDKKQPTMNNAWLKEQYSQSSFMIVTKMTPVYQDENCRRPHLQAISFAKDQKLPNIDERQNSVYTEYITPAGKFIYGWVKKKDVKLLDFGE